MNWTQKTAFIAILALLAPQAVLASAVFEQTIHDTEGTNGVARIHFGTQSPSDPVDCSLVEDKRVTQSTVRVADVSSTTPEIEIAWAERTSSGLGDVLFVENVQVPGPFPFTGTLTVEHNPIELGEVCSEDIGQWITLSVYGFGDNITYQGSGSDVFGAGYTELSDGSTSDFTTLPDAYFVLEGSNFSVSNIAAVSTIFTGGDDEASSTNPEASGGLTGIFANSLPLVIGVFAALIGLGIVVRYVRKWIGRR